MTITINDDNNFFVVDQVKNEENQMYFENYDLKSIVTPVKVSRLYRC